MEPKRKSSTQDPPPFSFSEHRKTLDLSKPEVVSDWVTQLRTAELHRSAEREIVNYLAEPKPATATMGWPRQDYQFSGTLKADQPTMLVPRQGRSLSDLTVEPDYSQYVIPKFRGIHYREEADSRFADPATYQAHAQGSQLQEDTLSDAVYKSSTEHPYDGRRRVTSASQRKYEKTYKDRSQRRRMLRQENRIRKVFGDTALSPKESRDFSNFKYVLPEPAEDFVDRVVSKRASLPVPDVPKFSQKKPAKQTTSLQFEEQMYVNAMEKYRKFQRKHTGDMGMFQVSMTDQPSHAAKYAFGEKFTTEEQRRFSEFSAKRKQPKQRANYSSLASEFRSQDDSSVDTGPRRRIKNTVGKMYSYLMPPTELYHPYARPTQSRSPEEMRHRKREREFEPPLPMTTMQETREKRIALKPNQARELETTFFTSVSSQHLVRERSVSVPTAKLDQYSKMSFTPTGSNMRTEFAKQQIAPVWNGVEQAAQQQRKILIPHGTFDTLFGAHIKGPQDGSQKSKL